MQKIAEKVLSYRLANGISQNRLAYMIGVHPNTIKNIENGRIQDIKPKTLYKLGTVIDISEELQNTIDNHKRKCYN